MKSIVLSGGPEVAWVSDADYPKLTANGQKWQLAVCGTNMYARRTIRRNGKKYSEYMHRVIMGVTDSEQQVDHINGKTLFNLRCNLEVVTLDENVRREHERKLGS